jgi:hypothetical protein
MSGVRRQPPITEFFCARVRIRPAPMWRPALAVFGVAPILPDPSELLHPQGHESETGSRSPEVSSIAFHAQPLDLPPVPLMDVCFAIICPLARHRRPPIQFLSIGSRVCSIKLSMLGSQKRAPAGRRRSESGFCLGRLASQATRIEITVKTSTLFPKICQVFFVHCQSSIKMSPPLPR